MRRVTEIHPAMIKLQKAVTSEQRWRIKPDIREVFSKVWGAPLEVSTSWLGRVRKFVGKLHHKTELVTILKVSDFDCSYKIVTKPVLVIC